MSADLTPAERRTLNAVMAHILAWGYPPSIRELCKIQKCSSTNAVSEMLSKLERKGFLRLSLHPGKARGITIMRDVDGNHVHLSFQTFDPNPPAEAKHP
jgi:repressor LexA